VGSTCLTCGQPASHTTFAKAIPKSEDLTVGASTIMPTSALIKATIPQPSDQERHRQRRSRKGGRPSAFGPSAYKDRNTVERALNQLRQHRAVATRYVNRDFIWRGTIRIWPRHPVS
jgi:hypothetical protein